VHNAALLCCNVLTTSIVETLYIKNIMSFHVGL